VAQAKEPSPPTGFEAKPEGDAVILADAIAATFERRATDVPVELPVGLADAFAHNPSSQV
jgi:hypothetical protein